MRDADDSLAARVEAAGRARFGRAGVEAMRPLEGGHSGLTQAATIAFGDRDPHPVVIKSTPPGREPVGRHDVLRQARIIAALAERSHVRLPKVELAEDSAATAQPAGCAGRRRRRPRSWGAAAARRR